MHKSVILQLKKVKHKGRGYVIYGKKVNAPIQLKEKETIKGIQYQLFGVVNHMGSLSFGHYTSFVKKDQWVYCDDQNIRKANVTGDNAYLLFYRQVEE